MTDNDIDTIGLSRRRILAGLGAVGVASAGAGLGTTAYFSDEESFDNNTLTAGELDLKLDYRATYAGGPGRLEEIDGWYPDFDVQEEEPGVYLLGEVPDVGGWSWPEEVQERDLCNPELNLVDGDAIPVFTLEDVKPGDYGEVTISLHICDNPSWVWMYGDLSGNAENGLTDPESAVDETGGDPGAGAGELADAIDVTMWYDEDCDNVYEPAGGDDDPICVELVLDVSGSMGTGNRLQDMKDGASTLVSTILGASSANRVGLTTFANSANTLVSVTDDEAALQNAISGLSANGSTAMADGVSTGQADLGNCPDGHDRIMVVFTDGQPSSGQDPASAAQAARNADPSTEIFAIGVAGAQQSTLESMASDPTDDHIFTATDDAALEQAFGQIAETLVGEQVIFEGSLAEAMAALSKDEGGIALDGNRSTEDRECFAGGLTQCIGFEWELPPDVGNEVQSDSVTFDVGFHAEQCRHNEEPGNPFEQPTPTPTATPNDTQTPE
ncbi:hypothetical protein GCM10027435_04110 [Haloparvum alkalitolerans]|uniref:vWA domain-containing protein n=1 Tax=Haloparvum alkalitolerans TaxID=1042953 RepID=UPI003CF11FF9